MRFALSLAFLPPFLFSAEAHAQSLLILSKGNHTLSIVNPSTLKVEWSAPSGPDPHEVIASSDGKVAYVSNYGGGAYNTITVVDLVNRKSLSVIDLGGLRGPHGLFVNGDKLWFTAEAAKAIGRYDPASDKVDWIMGTGQDRTHMIFVTDDRNRIVTTNISSATVTILEKNTRPRNQAPPPGPPPPGAPRVGSPPSGPRGSPDGEWDETVIQVGHGSEGFDVTPDRQEIWVGNSQDGTISVIDFATKKVVATIDASVRGANRLKFTPDGKLALVSTLSGSDLSVFDTKTRKSVARVHLGHGAAGILIEPGGARAFVACSPDNYVAVVDLKSLTVTNHIDAGKEPDGLAWAAR